MTSAAFSMPDERRQRVSIRRSLTTTSTETSSAAAEALEQVLNRKARKREGRPPAPNDAELETARKQSSVRV